MADVIDEDDFPSLEEVDERKGEALLDKSLEEEVNEEEDEDEDDDEFDYNPDDVVAKLKEKLIHIFHNDQVAEDIPLRLKMQNHGGWIPFSFLEAYDKHMKLFPEPKLWERAVSELPEVFEIKDTKFRRREILPDMEKRVNEESILLIFDKTDVAYADVNPIMRTLRKQKDIYKGSVYRLFTVGHSNIPRDVTRLLQQCPTLRQHTFVWYQVQRTQAALEYFNKLEQPTGVGFKAVALNDYLNEHRISLPSRQRGITVSGGAEELSKSCNYPRNSHNHRNKGSDGFSSPRKKCDWSTVRQGSVSKLSNATSDANTSGNNTPIEAIVETNVSKGRNVTQPWRRRRLAQSESDSGALTPLTCRPLFIHAVDGERPQFITKNNCTNGSSKDQIQVRLIRQPRPPSNEFGFDLEKLLADYKIGS